MLQYKDIKNLGELKSTFVLDHKKEDFFSDLISILKIGKYHSIFSGAKQKGISSLVLLRLLITFPFLGVENVYSFTKSYWAGFYHFGKDAYYRFLNNAKINWRAFLFGVVKCTLAAMSGRPKEAPLSNTPSALIFDDTPLEKTGHCIEGVSRIWNHVIQKSILGYQLLVMGLYDGTSFMPVDFSLHREKGKNKKKRFGLKPAHLKGQFSKKREGQWAGAKRKKELDITKIASVVKMIGRAREHGIRADYVLTDSWFTCWEVVCSVLDCNMKFIGMFSIVKTLFGYGNKKLTYNQIRHINKHRMKRNKQFNLFYIRTVVDWNGQMIVLYFTRKGSHGKWKTLLSTDLSADFTQTIEVYQIRWAIEVFFKEAKQLLGLGKCQSNDFDAQVASTTLVMAQYIFLSLRNRIDKYESIGGVFRGACEDMLELRLHERLIALLVAIVEVLETIFEELDREELTVKLLNDEAAFQKIKILLDHSSCASNKAA
jgi:hypothetical protein